MAKKLITIEEFQNELLDLMAAAEAADLDPDEIEAELDGQLMALREQREASAA